MQIQTVKPYNVKESILKHIFTKQFKLLKT